VTVGKRSYRVQFVDAASEGVVVDGGPGAEAARRTALHAMRKHAAALAPLFAKVARAHT